LGVFGPCDEESGFGYADGKPCIFLKLNKVFDWELESYENFSELPVEMPQTLKDHINRRIETKQNINYAWVSCEGVKSDDAKNLGTTIDYKSYDGSQGIGYEFTKFSNPGNDYQRLVAVQFNTIQRKFM
jgi:sodium/potassium-transporting ATPase subunit beta